MGYNAISVQLRLQLPTGTELGNYVVVVSVVVSVVVVVVIVVVVVVVVVVHPRNLTLKFG